MLDSIKQLVLNNVGVWHSFRYKGVRNQIDEFAGMIKNVYPAVFTIMLEDSSIKSFSYSDILVSTLEIID